MSENDEDDPLRSQRGGLFERLNFTLSHTDTRISDFCGRCRHNKTVNCCKKSRSLRAEQRALIVMGGFCKDRKYAKSSSHSTLVFLFPLYLKVIEWHAQKGFNVTEFRLFSVSESYVWTAFPSRRNGPSYCWLNLLNWRLRSERLLPCARRLGASLQF